MKIVIGLLTIFWLSASLAQNTRIGQTKNISKWSRNIRGVIVKESADVSRKYGGLLLKSIDEKMALVNMSRSSIMFDLTRNMAAIYLYPRAQGNEEAAPGPCFVIPIRGNYNRTADMVEARNRTYIPVSNSVPMEYNASPSSMSFTQRQAFRTASPIIHGFCYYSHVIDCTKTRTNAAGGIRILVQGLTRPILVNLDKSTRFDIRAFY